MTSISNLWMRLRYKLGRGIKGDANDVKGSRQALQNYWAAPPGKGNQPKAYINHPDRNEYLLDLLARNGKTGGSVLEIGCNVGRNLDALRLAGFDPITGIEINTQALEEMSRTYPALHGAARLINTPVEEALPTLKDAEFDVTFTMAVLLHIHPDSEWIFADMLRVTRGLLVVIENEDQSSYKIFPRDYGRIFRDLGATELMVETVGGSLAGYTARVFAPPQSTGDQATAPAEASAD